MKRQDSFDIVKFIMAMMVVAIHVNPIFGMGIGSPIFPITRIAVPMFFVFSGYFLFNKIGNKEGVEHFSVVKNYVVRLLKLYFVWFVLLLPITLLLRNYFANGLGDGIVRLIKGFFLGSTFRASWYLMALIIGTLIVFGLARAVNNKVIIFVGLILYICCSLLSNYSAFGYRLKIIKEIGEIYPNIFNGFSVSIIWIAIGKQFAENKSNLNIKLDAVIFVLSLVFLLAENKVIVNYKLSTSGRQNNDCYLMLLPVCYSLFILVQAWNVKLRNRDLITFFRISSTIIYCLHASLISVIGTVFLCIFLSGSSVTLSIILYILTVCICCGVSWVCLMAKKKDKVKVLQLLY